MNFFGSFTVTANLITELFSSEISSGTKLSRRHKVAAFYGIVDETNLYSVQKNSNKPANVSTLDIQKFLGVCLYTKLPRTRCYWRQDIGIPSIRSAMTMNTFEHLKSILHFNDNTKILERSDPHYDNLHKIRRVITELTTKFSSIPLESKLSIDEHFCATKARHHLKQYNPMKCTNGGSSYSCSVIPQDFRTTSKYIAEVTGLLKSNRAKLI